MELRRQLGPWTAAGVVVANIIGTGIFTLTGLLLFRLESGWMVLLCWLIGGVIALCGALSYAELSTMMPRAGGEYVYLREIYGPLPAFLTGWTSFIVGFSAPAAASAVAVSIYLTKAGWLPEVTGARKGVAIAIVLTLTFVHCTGVRWGARVQNALTVLKLLLLAGFLLAGFAWGKSSFEWMSVAAGSWEGGNWSQMGISLLLVMFAYSGWNAASYLAEEIVEPARNLPRALLGGTLAVVILYLLLNVLFLSAAPLDTLSGAVAVGDVAAEGLFGAGAARWLSLLISFALLSSVSAYILVGPRVYYAMARNRLFFQFAAYVHPRFATPSYSIAAQGVLASVMILSGTFEQLLFYIGFALGIFPWMTVAGLIWLRRREPDRPRPYRVWGYPFVPLIYLAASAGILVVAFAGRPWPSTAAILTVLAGIAVYKFTVGKGERSSQK